MTAAVDNPAPAVAAFLSRARPERAATAAFRRLGLPGPREEAWRYTPLRPVADVGFAAPEPGRAVAAVPDPGGPLVVFVDGYFRPELSRLPEGIGVRTGAANDAGDDRIDVLNAMLAEDGAAIDVPDGVDGGTLALVSIGGGNAVSFHPRHAVRLGRGARLALVEHASGEGSYLHNPVLTVQVAQDAVLTHLRLQDEAPDAFHLSLVRAEVAAGGTYDSFALAQGGRLARMEVHARLAGTGATAHLNAAQLLGESQHADFTTVVRHDAPATASRQTVKNVLTGRARGVFQGKIEVARAAQKTDGYQMNQTLLLSPQAEIDSKPQLEIYADDVKCSHGATVGALDPDQFFYLRSRGIPAAQARSILVRAFLAEALDPIGHEAGRALLEGAVERWWERHA